MEISRFQEGFSEHLIRRMLRALGGVFLATACALLAVPAGAAFTPHGHHRSVIVRPVRPYRAQKALVLPVQHEPPAYIRRPAPMMQASAAVTAQRPYLRMLMRIAVACVISVLSTFLSVGKALAISSARSSGSPGFLSGPVVKYGLFGAVMIAGAVFSREPPKAVTFTETETDDAEASASQEQEQPPSDSNTPAASSAPEDPTAILEDDTAVFGSLQARMAQLAEERRAVEEAEARGETPGDEPPAASPSDGGWGDTALLERPEEPKDDGNAADPTSVEFPTGFPLVDGEVKEKEPPPPIASTEDIAMLNRMFGNSAE
jgi:hypothetical protein